MTPKDASSKPVFSSPTVEEYEFESTEEETDFYIDPVAEKKLLRKLDWKLIPWLCLLYLISFLDRTNIGNAKIQGMVSIPKDNLPWYLTPTRATEGLELDGGSVQYDVDDILHHLFYFWYVSTLQEACADLLRGPFQHILETI